MTSSDNTARDALARHICGRICDSNRTHDELRVVDDLLTRLETGADRYGGLDLLRDDRDWDQQAVEELDDFIAYLAMKKIARQHKRRERIECDVHDRVEPCLAELVCVVGDK